MYALVEIKGKQFKAEAGKVLKVPRFEEEKGSSVVLDGVLMVSGDKGVTIGTPHVPGASVKAKIEDHGKEDKIVVYKYKRRKSYRRKNGHRQGFSLLKIESLEGI